MRIKQATVCRTCRSHKLGCDGKRPACSQCLFLGRSCEGYQVDPVFVPYQPMPQKRRPRKAARPSSSPREAAQASTTPQSKTGSNDLTNTHIMKAWQCPSPSPIDPPTAGEFTAVILNCFTPASKFVRSSPDTSAIQVCGAWVGVLPRLVDDMPSGSLISAAVKAFGTAILDRGPDGRSMNFRSLEAYNSTLQRLRHDLVAQSMSFNVNTAASIACLAMAELISPTGTNGFHTHYAGLSVLFQFYPPELFSSDVYHTIFVGCRPILLFHALDKRKHTFLAKDHWKAKPFRLHPPSYLQLLINDTAVLPSLLEAVDSLSSLPIEKAISEAQQVRIGLLEMHRNLCKWEILHKMDAISFLFRSIMEANIYIHTLSFQIICLTEMKKVTVFLADHGSSTLGLTAASFAELGIDYSGEKLCELASKICQKLEYFLQDGMKLFGPASAVFPLRIAYDVLSRDDERNQEKIKQCRELVDQICERGISAIPYFPARFIENRTLDKFNE